MRCQDDQRRFGKRGISEQTFTFLRESSLSVHVTSHHNFFFLYFVNDDDDDTNSEREREREIDWKSF